MPMILPVFSGRAFSIQAAGRSWLQKFSVGEMRLIRWNYLPLSWGALLINRPC